jgi:hypothetical protein
MGRSLSLGVPEDHWTTIAARLWPRSSEQPDFSGYWNLSLLDYHPTIRPP